MKTEKPINIILLGEPGAGKATQSARLVKKYGLYDFDMGKELTRLRTQNERIDSLLKRNYDQGKLTPTTVVQNILRSTIAAIPDTQGILFDGHPKMMSEAKLVARLLAKHGRRTPVFIYLSVPLSETVKRVQGRKGYFGGKYGRRHDDTVEALKNRARYFRTNIADVAAFFKSHYPYAKVSGLGTVSEVNKRLVKAIEVLAKHV